MRILPFETAREFMDGQYEKVKEKSNEEKRESLYRAMRDIYDAEEHHILGKGKAIRYFFENTDVFVNPCDIFADLCDVECTPVRIRDDEHRARLCRSEDTKMLIKAGAMKAMADFGHTAPDWERVLRLGIPGIIAEARELLRAERETLGSTPEKCAFYLAVIEAYEGIITYIKRLRDAVSLTVSPSSDFTAENLSAIAERAPETLAEAMQLYFIFYRAQQFADGAVLRSLGSIDHLLYPFYLKDLKRGVSEEEIRELVRYFLYKWNSMRTLANIPFDIGSEANELTYIIVSEYGKLSLPDPKIHVKCSDKTPKKLLLMILELVKGGNNSFVFVNERIVISALENIGISTEDANNYTLIGCYEPSAVGKELPCTLNGRVSLPMATEFVLKRGKTYPDFESFFLEVMKEVSFFIDTAIDEVIRIERKYPDIVMTPILSATYTDAMAKGVDVYSGGAKYNNSSVCAFGIATFIDGLIAVKRAVYEDKLITLPALWDILAANWAGGEELRAKIRNSYPKYGSGDPEADALTSRVINMLSDMVNNKDNGRGGVFRLGLFSIDWIFAFGKKLAASPDGRYKGEPVSKNLSASIGMDKRGVTGIIRSVTEQSHSLIPDGAVLDISLHPSSVKGDEGSEIMYGLLKTYLDGDGFAIQMNILSPETLRAAQKEPEKYRNLQVRLCGWNVYFTDLDEAAQNNLIDSMSEE